MTTQSVLAMQNTGTPQAYRIVGGTPTAIGSAFGSAEPSSGTGGSFYYACNRIIQFSGNPNSTKVLLCAFIKNQIYSWDGSSWTLRYTTSTTVESGFIGGGGAYKTGFHFVNVNGVRTCCAVWCDQAGPGNMYTVVSTDGINWVETTQATLGGWNLGNHQWQGEIVFNNVFYIFTNVGITRWDPATNAISQVTPTNMDLSGPADFLVYGGNLYLLKENTSVKGWWIWVLNGSSWQTVVQLGTPGNAGVDLTINQTIPAQPVFFDGGDGFAYAIYVNLHTSSAYGYAAAKLTLTGLTGSTSDISSTVLPSSWLYSGTPPGVYDLTCMSETQTNLTSPTIHLWMTSAHTSTVINYYLWNGNATLIGSSGSANDSGGDVSMRLPRVKAGSGDRIWTTSDFDTWRVAPTTQESGGLDYYFQAMGPVGNESKSWSLYHDENLQIPKALGTLSNPSALSTTIASGSNAQSLPQGTINLASNAGFPVAPFTQVTSGSNSVNVSTFAGAGTLNVTSTTSFASSGTIQVQTGSGTVAITYTGKTSTTFTGCNSSGGSGVLSTNNYVAQSAKTILVQTNANTTAVAGGSVGQTLPQASITVSSTTGFPSSGYLIVPTTSGNQVVAYTGTSGGNTFTGCTGGSGTGTMQSTANGVISLQQVTYLANAGTTQLVGCSGGSGTMSTSGAVYSGPSPSPTLHAGNQQLDGVTCDALTAVPTTYKVTWLAQSSDGLTANEKTRVKGTLF